jgi:hypothetical protein
MKPTDPPPPKATAGEAPPAKGSSASAHGHGDHRDPAELHNDDVAHEESDVDIRQLLVFSGGLAAVVAVVAVLMYGLFQLLEGQARRNDPALPPRAAASAQMPTRTTGSPFFGTAKAPQLLTNEPALLQEIHGREQQQLSGYGWVDQAGGVARMPIEEAKKLLAERGLPARPGVDPREGTTLPAQGESTGGRVITAPPPTEGAPAAAPAPAPAPKPAGHGGH